VYRTEVAEGNLEDSRQPVPRQPVPADRARVRVVGELRIPLAGPYAPRAQLIRFPDGRLLWRLRLWEYVRPVTHVVGTDTLRAFARINGLPALRAEIDRMVEEACTPTRA
jgi:hypothetical protein